MKKIKSMLARNYSPGSAALTVFLSLIILLNSWQRYFNVDELEHVHSGWYVAHGYLPYVDFFEHHHPFLWYLLAPLFLILGDTTLILLLARLMMFMLILGTGYFTYRVALQASRSEGAARISVLLLFSLFLFVQPALEIRPDLPQVFFGLVSYYFLIGYFQDGGDRKVAFAGLAAAAAFLFLQKMVFLLFGLGVIFLYKYLRRQITFRPIFIFGICFSLPVAIFLGGLWLSGSLKDYLLLGWFFNLKPILLLSVGEVYRISLLANLLFWVIAPVSLLFLGFRKGVNAETRTVVFLGVFLSLAALKVKHPHPQYFLPALPFLAIAAGTFLENVFDRFRWRNPVRIMILLILISEPAVFLVKESRDTNREQMARINYVLRNTIDSDRLYDGLMFFNLFRPDLHYFWFNNQPWGGLERYRRLAKNKYVGKYVNPGPGRFDMCELIKTQKPKFIMGFTYMQEKCGLRELYEDTGFERIKIRKERMNGPAR